MECLCVCEGLFYINLHFSLKNKRYSEKSFQKAAISNNLSQLKIKLFKTVF